MPKRSFDLFELVRMVIVNRGLIIAITVIVALGAVAYSLLVPEIWRSSASFFAVGEGDNALPINLEGLSGLSSGLLGMQSSGKAVNFVTVMESRSMGEEVIRKFRLIDYFKLDNPDSLRNMDDALTKLNERIMGIGWNDNSGLISISAKTKDKKLSQDIVKYYLQRLDEYNRTQKVTQGKLNREFLEGRVKETKAILDSLISVNRSFQEKNKAIDLDTQAQAMIDTYGGVIAEKMKLDIELELAKTNYGADNPLLRQLEIKKTGLEQQIRSLEKSGKTPKPEYLLDISKIPGMASEYAQIKMNLEIYQKVFEFLYPQYEAARLSELKDLPTIDILDQPRMAGRRESPKRALICVVATLLGFVLAVLLALVKEALSGHREQLAMLKRAWKKGRTDEQL